MRPIVCEWETTASCNLRCPHCSADAGTPWDEELGRDEALALADEIAALGCRWVTLTGGETLLRPDWEAIVERLVARGLVVSLLSNGWAIDTPLARRIARARVSQVTLSLDGVGDIHDDIRARPGAFAAVLRAARELRTVGVPFGVATTVFEQNLAALGSLHELAVRLGAEHWHVLLGRPPRQGLRGARKVDWLRVGRLPALLTRLRRLRCRSELQIVLGDNLGCGAPGGACRAGITHFAIDPRGNVKGCSAMPASGQWVEGNVRTQRLDTIWMRAGAFSYNRAFDPTHLAGGCARCDQQAICRGGCHWSTGFSERDIDNAFCEHRYARRTRSWHERPTGAAVTLGLALAGCGQPSPPQTPAADPSYPCGIETRLEAAQTPSCLERKEVLRECTFRCCLSRAVAPPDLVERCRAEAERYQRECGTED